MIANSPMTQRQRVTLAAHTARGALPCLPHCFRGSGNICTASRWPPAERGSGLSSSGGPARYEIRIEGALGSRWAAWFDGLQVESEGTQTVISGLLADQAALHGLLAKARDLGLGLISVRRLDPDETGNGRSNEVLRPGS